MVSISFLPTSPADNHFSGYRRIILREPDGRLISGDWLRVQQPVASVFRGIQHLHCERDKRVGFDAAFLARFQMFAVSAQCRKILALGAQFGDKFVEYGHQRAPSLLLTSPSIIW